MRKHEDIASHTQQTPLNRQWSFTVATIVFLTLLCANFATAVSLLPHSSATATYETSIHS